MSVVPPFELVFAHQTFDQITKFSKKASCHVCGRKENVKTGKTPVVSSAHRPITCVIWQLCVDCYDLGYRPPDETSALGGPKLTYICYGTENRPAVEIN